MSIPLPTPSQPVPGDAPPGRHGHRHVGRSRAILLAGTAAGVLDLVFIFSLMGSRGVSPVMILQSIASGLLGRDAFAGGAGIALLGVALHFAIAVAMAAFFAVALTAVPQLRRRLVAAGAAYGVILYVVMNFVVIPLSRAPLGRPPLLMAAADVASHMFLVGVPIALILGRLHACRPS